MTDATAARAFAESVDRLMSVDVVGRGFIGVAYELARKQAGEPLIWQAGERLRSAMSVSETPVVAIVTGATSQRVGLPDWIGEMDGPAGAIALARTLALAYRAVPVLMTDPDQSPMLSKAAASLGLYTLPIADVCRQAEALNHTSSVAMMEIPADTAAARGQAEQFLSEQRLVAAIAIEKAGGNEHGVFHNSQKLDTSPGKARADELFKLCRARDILTIGIGDGGNEIGMGNIKPDLLKAFPDMATSHSSLGGSILAEQTVDCLIAATVSNWGAYALSAYLAYAAGKPYACHTPAREERLLDGAARAGYMHLDGLATPDCDGLPVEVHAAFVRLLSTMVLWPPLKYGRVGYLKDMLPA